MANIFTGIKPWSIHHTDGIFKELDKIGEGFLTIVIGSAPREPIAIQHSKYQGKPFFDLLVNDLTRRPYIITIYNGDQEEFNRLKSPLREMFGKDITPLPPLQRNPLHISESEQEFKRDYNAWRPYLNGN